VRLDKYQEPVPGVVALKNTNPTKTPGWKKGQHRSLKEKDAVRKRWLKELTDNPSTDNRLNLKMSPEKRDTLHRLAKKDGVSPGIVLRRLIMKQGFETFGEAVQ
jgi:hypothetical protein